MVRAAPPVREPDPREQAEWFRNLPDHAKEEFRERWRIQEGRAERQVERRRSTEVRYLVEGVMLFAVLEFFFFGLSAGRLLLLAVPGIALGWICYRIRAGCWRYVAVAAPFHLAVYGALGLIMVGHFIVFVCVAAALGFTHEMLRADGTE
jgi:hypothetical protein